MNYPERDTFTISITDVPAYANRSLSTVDGQVEDKGSYRLLAHKQVMERLRDMGLSIRQQEAQAREWLAKRLVVNTLMDDHHFTAEGIHPLRAPLVVFTAAGSCHLQSYGVSIEIQSSLPYSGDIKLGRFQKMPQSRQRIATEAKGPVAIDAYTHVPYHSRTFGDSRMNSIAGKVRVAFKVIEQSPMPNLTRRMPPYRRRS